jgi:hypothetical protein
MKIRKWVTDEREIEIDVCWEDIREILSDEPGEATIRTLANVHGIIKGADPDKLTPEHRKLFADALRVEADRFAAGKG